MNNINIKMLQHYRININIQPANGRAGKKQTMRCKNEK